MYGFRKPYTSADFAGANYWGVDFKTMVVSTQVIGYMMSKFIGIKVIAEMPSNRRVAALLGLIALAELALGLFGVVSRPWNAACLFLNGLSLGMVFGIVLSFLEGRRLTEALVAGLCASFILADGVTKSVGAWLLESGVTEDWMPFTAGLVFVLPLLLFAGMLSRIPPPDASDVLARTERQAMTRAERWSLYSRYGVGLTLLVFVYLLITIVRSIRADFAPELWRLLGEPAAAATFTNSEMLVALGVLAVNGAVVCIRNNRLAFWTSLAICCTGFLVIIAVLVGRQANAISAFPYMVLMGFGLYLPYVAMHTTVFERLLAMQRERGNLGFLMYVADAFGYLGYVFVMITRNFYPNKESYLELFTSLCWGAACTSLVGVILCWRYFLVRTNQQLEGAAGMPGTLHPNQEV